MKPVLNTHYLSEPSLSFLLILVFFYLLFIIIISFFA